MLRGESEVLTDIGIADGDIVAFEEQLTDDVESLDLEDRLVVPGFVESHIHLDKACILNRCKSEQGTLDEAIREVSVAKRAFTVEDIQMRAVDTLERCILQGTTRMRTHLEVDPVIGVKSIEGVLPLVKDYAWAIDLEICVFPQEGLLNNPGTEELMVRALEMGAHVVGGCPYTDSDPRGQIERVFELARQFDVDIDFHLDFDTDPKEMTVSDVCELTRRHNYYGRVTIGHVSKLSALPNDALVSVASELADAGVAVTVLPSTDLYLMGADKDYNIVRGVAPVHRLLEQGVNCALSTNNVLNPFTPFGDCSLVRMANLYANIAQIGTEFGFRRCLEMITERPAQMMRLDDYGITIGCPADIVVLDCSSAPAAIQELAPALMGFKGGQQTFNRQPPVLLRP